MFDTKRNRDNPAVSRLRKRSPHDSNPDCPNCERLRTQNNTLRTKKALQKLN